MPTYYGLVHKTTDLDDSVQTVKGATGRMFSLNVQNDSGATAYVQAFDVSGTVTLATTEAELQIAVADNDNEHLPWPIGWPFSNALKIAATTALNGDTGSADGVDISIVYE